MSNGNDLETGRIERFVQLVTV